jgi:hypothetical protein
MTHPETPDAGEQMSERNEERVRHWPPEYRAKAIAALREGKAFCPSCHWAGHMNCGYFDECDAFVEPELRS